MPDTGYPAVVEALRAAGCVFAEDEAHLLLAATADDDQRVAMVARRVAGEPLEHVLGWAMFAGLRLRVATGVFVPRHRSEFLVDVAAPMVGRDSLVVDVCCGSGAIGAALAAARPGIGLYGTDVDPAAVACAAGNADGTFVVGDLLDPLPGTLRGRIDVVLCSAPYVPRAQLALLPREAREHETTVALDGGTDGLAVYRRLAAQLPGWLRSGGHALFEVGTDQADAACAIIRDAGLDPQVRSDDDCTVVVGYHP